MLWYAQIELEQITGKQNVRRQAFQVLFEAMSAAAVAMGGVATAIGDGDAGAGDDDDASDPSSRRWRMNSHTGHHINALEEGRGRRGSFRGRGQGRGNVPSENSSSFQRGRGRARGGYNGRGRAGFTNFLSYIEMEQNNWQTGCQEAGLAAVVSGPVVIGTIQDGGAAVTAAAAAVFGVASGTVATGGASAAAVAMGGAATAIGDGDAGAGDDDDASDPSSRRWRMNRHTGHHINALEEYFKEHSHPNQLQRNELALRLGMHPTQVMCWFQNKRTQMRSQSRREENEVLKSENNMLRAQIKHFTEVLSKNICPQCGVSSSQQYVDENILRSENIHLREEAEQMESTLRSYMARENPQNLPHNI
ncbi:hypothetical protein POM88_005942 [Heracleum sosnowskyi]|uniref:Homeobox domain-containing protein n=1 Tax=Heracleum sosnowskyi TaxID=360622 RepID=A0AAD8N4B6_9APIA|nr:hypothetical protein POM88_005942 [Heracleum sosnowskyi]